MQGTFASTLAALANSPEVAKASGISEECTLIIDMIERMIGDIDVLHEKTGREGADLIIANIRAGLHREGFDD